MEGDGMIAVVRGLRDSSLCVTLLDKNGQYTFMPNSASKSSHPNTIYANAQTDTVSQTPGGEVHPHCESSSQVIDGRYASVYKTTHCKMIPTSPQVESTEFPPQRSELSRGHGNFEVGGLGSGETRFNPSRTSSYKGGLSWPDRGSVFTARPVVEPCAFANSLRKYPSISPERSCEIVERLINYSQIKHSQKQQKYQVSQFRSESSTRSRKLEADVRTDESPTRERSGKCDVDRRYDKNYDIRYLTTSNSVNPQATTNNQYCPVTKLPPEQKRNQTDLYPSKSVNIETQAEISIMSRGVATLPTKVATVKNVAISSTPTSTLSDQSLNKSSKSIQTLDLHHSLQIIKSVQTCFSSIDIKKHKQIGNRRSKSQEYVKVNDLEDEIVTLIQDIAPTDDRESIREEVMKKLKDILDSDKNDRFKIKFGQCVRDQLCMDTDYSDLSDEIMSKIKKFNVFNQKFDVYRAELQPYRNNNYKDHNVENIIRDWLKDIPIKSQDHLGKSIKTEHLLHAVAIKIKEIVNNKLKFETEKTSRNEILNLIKDMPIAVSNNNKRCFLNQLVTELLRKIKDLPTPVSTSKRTLKINNNFEQSFDVYDTAFNKKNPLTKEEEVRTFVRKELFDFTQKCHLKICTESLDELELELSEIILDSFDYIRNSKDDRVKHEVLGAVLDLLSISEQLGIYFATNFVSNLKEKYKEMPQLKSQSFVIFNEGNDKNNIINQQSKQKINVDNDISGSLEWYQDQLVLKINEWILEVTDLNPSHNETKTAINDLAEGIIDRLKFLEINPSNKGIENEIENLKYQVFKSMHKLIDEHDLVILEHAPELMHKIKSIPVPTITKKIIDYDKDLAVCNETSGKENRINQNMSSNQIPGPVHIVGYNEFQNTMNSNDTSYNDKICCKQKPCCDTKPCCSHKSRPDFSGFGGIVPSENTDKSTAIKKECKCSQKREREQTSIKIESEYHSPSKIADSGKKGFVKRARIDKVRSNKVNMATDQKFSELYTKTDMNHSNDGSKFDCCGHMTDDKYISMVPYNMGADTIVPGSPMPSNMSANSISPSSITPGATVPITTPYSMGSNTATPHCSMPCNMSANRTLGGRTPGATDPWMPPDTMTCNGPVTGSNIPGTAVTVDTASDSRYPGRMVPGSPTLYNKNTGGSVPCMQGNAVACGSSAQSRRHSLPTPARSPTRIQDLTGNKRHSSPEAYGTASRQPSDCRESCCNLPHGSPNVNETRKPILQPQSRRLSAGIISAPKRVSLNTQPTISDISDETIHTFQESNDDFDQFLKDWVQKVPIAENPEIADKARLGIYNGIWIEITKLKLNPEAINNPFYYKEALDGEIDSLLDCLPQTEEFMRVRNDLKKEVIDKAADINQFVSVAALPSSFKQQLIDNVTNNIPRDPNGEFILQDNVINRIAENFIVYTKYKDTDAIKANVFRTKLLKQIHELVSNINQMQNVDIKSTTDSVIHALERVPIPSNETLYIEAEEILLGHEIEQWFSDLPLEPPGDCRQTVARRKHREMLTKKLHDIENSNNNEQEMKEEIQKFLSKLPVRPNALQDIHFMVDELLNRLKSRLNDFGKRKVVGFPDYDEFSKNMPLCSSFHDDHGTEQSSSYMIVDGQRLEQPYTCRQPSQNAVPESQLEWLSLEETNAPSQMRALQVNLPPPNCKCSTPVDHSSASCQTSVSGSSNARPQGQSFSCQISTGRPPDPRPQATSSYCQTLLGAVPNSQQEWFSLEETRAPSQMKGLQVNIPPCCMPQQTPISTFSQTPIPGPSEPLFNGPYSTAPGSDKAVSCCMDQTSRQRLTLTRTPSIRSSTPCKIHSQASMQSYTNIPYPGSTQTKPICSTAQQTPGTQTSESCQTMRPQPHHEKSIGNNVPELCCRGTSTPNTSDQIRAEAQSRSTSPKPIEVERSTKKFSTSTGRNEKYNCSSSFRRESTNYQRKGRDDQSPESSPIEEDITPCFQPCGRPKKQKRVPCRKRLDFDDSDSDKERGQLRMCVCMGRSRIRRPMPCRPCEGLDLEYVPLCPIKYSRYPPCFY